MTEELLIKANSSYRRFNLSVGLPEKERDNLRNEFRGHLLRAVKECDASKMSIGAVRDAENKILADTAPFSAAAFTEDLEYEKRSIREKRSAISEYLVAKANMDAFQNKYKSISENEKIALMPMFMEFDDKYIAAKNDMEYFLVLSADDDDDLKKRDAEIDRQLAWARSEIASGKTEIVPPAPSKKDGGVVTKYLIKLKNDKISVKDIEPPSVPEEPYAVEPEAPESVEVENVPPVFDSPVAEQAEFFPHSYNPVNLSAIEQRILILSNKINSIPTSKIKLSNAEAELLIEKIRLQSQIEVAKLRSEFEQIRSVFNSQLYEMAAEIADLKTKVKAAKDDIEDIKFNADSARRSRNAAQVYAQNAAQISKKLQNIIKYLSNDANITGKNGKK